MASDAEHHATMRDVPIGILATGTREEFASIGKIAMPADRDRHQAKVAEA